MAEDFVFERPEKFKSAVLPEEEQEQLNDIIDRLFEISAGKELAQKSKIMKASENFFVDVARGGSFRNLVIKPSAGDTAHDVEVSADELIVKDSDNVSKCLNSFSHTAALDGGIGPNALDNGYPAADSWYYIWAIASVDRTALLISTSATDPDMPEDFTFKAIIGQFETDGSANIYYFHQEDKWWFAEHETDYGPFNNTTFAALDLSANHSAIAGTAILLVEADRDTAPGWVEWRITGSTGTGHHLLYVFSPSEISTTLSELPLVNGQIDLRVTSSGVEYLVHYVGALLKI